ncbi:hypothetical protein [Prochlorococcus sp. MIT 1307]|uniref:hypothetical protein n=1 Tax=Prochlorococcus sp. MIT 1307 TaxID=3096219 RepID=UPI002A76038D|nr:hypothetical protein [Prochlorococcus sp. MIT 1307]
MVCKRAFLVGAGHLSDDEMRSGSTALSSVWGGELLEYSCADDPREVLASLSKENGLVQVLGDPAINYCYRGSWLEALAAWREPTILMASSDSSGEMTGCASAYVALCQVLSVPLLGIIQVGGVWTPLHRKLDGLPWCGLIPGSEGNKLLSNDNSGKDQEIKVEEVVFRLRQRMLNLSFK